MQQRTGPNFRRERLIIFLVTTLSVVAVVTGLVVLLLGAFPEEPGQNRDMIAAAPLLSIGMAYLALQVLVKPHPHELVRHFLVASAFILWGIVQLLPASPVARALGHLVIVLYVVDLALIVRDQLLRQRNQYAPKASSG